MDIIREEGPWVEAPAPIVCLPWEPGALPTGGQLARMSPGCMTPEELKRAWRELVGSKPLLALGHLVGKPWPPEPE